MVKVLLVLVAALALLAPMPAQAHHQIYSSGNLAMFEDNEHFLQSECDDIVEVRVNYDDSLATTYNYRIAAVERAAENAWNQHNLCEPQAFSMPRSTVATNNADQRVKVEFISGATVDFSPDTTGLDDPFDGVGNGTYSMSNCDMDGSTTNQIVVEYKSMGVTGPWAYVWNCNLGSPGHKIFTSVIRINSDFTWYWDADPDGIESCGYPLNGGDDYPQDFYHATLCEHDFDGVMAQELGHSVGQVGSASYGGHFPEADPASPSACPGNPLQDDWDVDRSTMCPGYYPGKHAYRHTESHDRTHNNSLYTDWSGNPLG